jgi:hypothetical protein
VSRSTLLTARLVVVADDFGMVRNVAYRQVEQFHRFRMVNRENTQSLRYSHAPALLKLV